MKQLIYFNRNTIILLLPLLLNACSIFNKPKKQQKTPQLIEVYYADKKGNRFTEQYPPHNPMYLIILSKNAIGKEVTVNIKHDTTEEFIYNNTYLKNNTMRFKLRKNKEKHKFYIYNPKSKYHKYLKEKATNPNKKKTYYWITTYYLRIIDYFNL